MSNDNVNEPTPRPAIRLNLAVIVLASLATCAVCDHNESKVEAACFEAGHSPEECDL